MVTSFLTLQRNAGKNNAEVIIDPFRVDGLSINCPLYRPFVKD